MMKVMTVLPVKVEVMMMKGGRSHLVSALLEGRLSSWITRSDSVLLSPPSLSSLKLECDKLASEKSEMQRHYIMVSYVCAARQSWWLTQNAIFSLFLTNVDFGCCATSLYFHSTSSIPFIIFPFAQQVIFIDFLKIACKWFQLAKKWRRRCASLEKCFLCLGIWQLHY